MRFLIVLGLVLILGSVPKIQIADHRLVERASTEAQEIESKPLKKQKPKSVLAVKTADARTQVSGDKADWLKASGIPSNQWGLVDYLVSKESGWNPNAVNKSSGACGLGQQLPCGKWAGEWNDPVSALKNMHQYVLGRYGTWQTAVNHSKANGWY